MILIAWLEVCSEVVEVHHPSSAHQLWTCCGGNAERQEPQRGRGMAGGGGEIKHFALPHVVSSEDSWGGRIRPGWDRGDLVR